MKITVTLMLLSAICAAQSVRVPTVTRTVQLFGELERKLASADKAARAQMLTEDFEERLCADPGTPVPRNEWLQKVALLGTQFSQEAVHTFGEIAVYSGLRSADNGHDMIVDTWKQGDGGWKLAVRYRCPASGEKPQQSGLPKRY